MRLRTIQPLTAAFAFLVVASCASLETVRARNRTNLMHLSPGLSKAAVLETMGVGTITTEWGEKVTQPHRNEAYEAGGHFWEILYYYTDIKASDGAVTDDELTPLVLRDGRLVGWGWAYWDNVIATYQIRVRR